MSCRAFTFYVSNIMTLFGYISETVQQGLRVTINNHNIVKDWFKRWLPFNNNDKIRAVELGFKKPRFFRFF